MEDPGLQILLIDDDDDVRRTLGAHLTGRGHTTRTAPTGASGLSLLRQGPADVVITDMRMPGLSGLDVLAQVRTDWPESEVVVITAFGDVESAVEAMRAGAFDYFTKPYEVHAISACLQRTARFKALRREKDRMQQRLRAIGVSERRRYALEGLIGESAAMAAVRDSVLQVAATPDTTVLISGETGTGKELVARALHYEGHRAEGPFVAVDCTSIPVALVESELFGHVRGAFTDAREDRQGLIEQADGGTLFLDEIGDMDLAVQPRLLRVLEERTVRRLGDGRERPVDIRVVAATNQDLRAAVATGKFREDLQFRLNAFEIHLPRLRDRGGDVTLLAQHFLQRYARDLRRNVANFEPSAQTALQQHPFHGNVRELRNVVERAVIQCQGGLLTAADLDLVMPEVTAPLARANRSSRPWT